MKAKPAIAAAAFAAVHLLTGQAAAQATDAQKRAAAEKWAQMTPEERAAARDKARAKWDAMTPEEQAAAKRRFAERHPQAAKPLEARPAASAPSR